MLAPAITTAVTEVRVSAWAALASPIPDREYTASPARAASRPAATDASSRVRGTRTPMRLAFTGSEPAARSARPPRVRWMTNHMTTATATANARIRGTPATARPRVVRTSARAEPPGLGRSTCARPSTAIELTSVAITGGSERRVTRRPFTHPTAAPAASASSTPMRK